MRTRYGLVVGVALICVGLLPSTASGAGLWDGKWKIRVEGGAPGKMCLKESGNFVEGKFQSEDPGKFGVISGDLTLRDQNWDGSYKDKGTGDKGGFHAEQGEADAFDGSFKPRGSDRRYDWGGVRTDKNIGYRDCLKSIGA